jgi:putative hydrolase of the HAD superfamily
MATAQHYLVAFFDIGGTLGSVIENGGTRIFRPFPSSTELLQVFRKTLGLRIGVITNVAPGMTTEEVLVFLASAGWSALIEDTLVITSRDAGARKPQHEIYEFAAHRSGVLISQCLYIGEEVDQVDGALVAGMGGLLKEPK